MPEIQKLAEGFEKIPFRLRDIWKPLLARTYSQEQLDIKVKKAQSDTTEKISTIFGFYIPFLAENLKVFENLGEGMFRNIPLDEEVAEADAVATDVDTNDPGIIYAYSFPSIQNDGIYPIKIGLTTTGDAETRVAQQCRQACCFEHPIILKWWSVQRVAAVEMAIHRTLEARGSKRLAPGNEWFNTSLEEIESILHFITTG